MGWLLPGLVLIYKFDFLDAFFKFNIVNELNLINYKFHYLVYNIWFHISLLFGSKVKFNIRFQSHKSAMNFEDWLLSCNKYMWINLELYCLRNLYRR